MSLCGSRLAPNRSGLIFHTTLPSASASTSGELSGRAPARLLAHGRPITDSRVPWINRVDGDGAAEVRDLRVRDRGRPIARPNDDKGHSDARRRIEIQPTP